MSALGDGFMGVKMAEILIAAVNASFSHTNIAVRSISLFCQKKLQVQDDFITFDEWTINQQPLEIIRSILNHKPKIVMFSSVGTQSNLKTALEKGACDFVQKPANAEEIQNILSKLIGG